MYEFIYFIVVAYFICALVQMFGSNTKAGRTAGNLKGLADDALDTFNESIEESRKANQTKAKSSK